MKQSLHLAGWHRAMTVSDVTSNVRQSRVLLSCNERKEIRINATFLRQPLKNVAPTINFLFHFSDNALL
jgi:hypothetical protein